MSLKSLNLLDVDTNSLLISKDDCTSDVPIQEGVYLYIGNIPSELKTADLRNIFTDVIEKSSFICFHYRHRPEKNVILDSASSDSKATAGETCCCVVNIKKQHYDSFIEKYNNIRWFSKAFKKFERKINIRKLKLNPNNETEYFLSKAEKRKDKHFDDQTIYKSDLKKFIELNPPKLEMPQGNVGTPTKYFLQLISECKMPSSVLKRLQIDFPKRSKNGNYSRVPMLYHSQHSKNTSDDNCSSQKESIYSDPTEVSDERCNSPLCDDNKSSEHEDDDAEDWERHEALHDDVDNQSRPKEKLFEEELEVQWEKGGSGLVFYTDAQYWNEMKGKDFDEETADDWDVDYSIYYEDGAGDKPARDQLQMRIEERRRKGLDDGPSKYSHIRRLEKNNKRKMDNFAAFEQYSKGFGSKVLRKQGWTVGCGLGVRKDGIAEPISSEIPKTSASREKIGFGYHGEKLERNVTKVKATRDVYISTIYDEKDGPQFDAMRYYGQEILKYRPSKIDFLKEKKS